MYAVKDQIVIDGLTRRVEALLAMLEKQSKAHHEQTKSLKDENKRMRVCFQSCIHHLKIQVIIANFGVRNRIMRLKSWRNWESCRKYALKILPNSWLSTTSAPNILQELR